MSEKTTNNNAQTQQRLDDEARVKVLSPSALVMKRFLRNRLGVAGAVILIAMFAFSFVGGFFTPYGQTEVFRKTEVIVQDYANFAQNKELRFVSSPDANFSMSDQAKFILAKNKGQNTFEAGKNTYTWEQIAEDVYFFATAQEVASVRQMPGKFDYTPAKGIVLSEDLKKAYEAAAKAGDETFEFENETYAITQQGKKATIGKQNIAALASLHVFNAGQKENQSTVDNFNFRLAVEKAIANQESNITFDGQEYTLVLDDGRTEIYQGTKTNQNEAFAVASTMLSKAVASDITLSLRFQNAALEAIGNKEESFLYTDDQGKEEEFFVTNKVGNYTIRKESPAVRIDMYAFPTKEHLLGTDANGMDVMTRLMFGGRVSLMVGFVVVIIELILGIVLGGVAGYFGGWIDTILMRFIDLVNSIPYYPVMIILGAVMDSMRIDPYIRIWFLMIVLGLLGWTGIARTVRGQILTLREQDFMVATEATGIRVSRRIFKHLVPNIMPLLIVQATMALGGIIITEATLSFLGLGLKYPLASWGTIINAATDVHIMTNYWFIWLPAGLLILITVLGFNFVGDGLRDAFDPKMKR